MFAAAQLELRVAGPVTRGHPVVVLGEDGPVRGDEHGPERFVARFQGLGSQLHAAAQIPQFSLVHDNAPNV